MKSTLRGAVSTLAVLTFLAGCSSTSSDGDAESPVDTPAANDALGWTSYDASLQVQHAEVATHAIEEDLGPEAYLRFFYARALDGGGAQSAGTWTPAGQWVRVDDAAYPYQLFVPEDLPDTGAPLVLALHSRGEQGSDNERQLSVQYVTAWAEHMEEPTLILAPMAPQGTPEWSVDTLDSLIDAVAERYAVDTNRLYINGHSFGGAGTALMLSGSTYSFAAATLFAPAIRDTSTLDLAKIAKVPQRYFVSESDTVIDNDAVKGLYDALSALGAAGSVTE